MLLATKYRPKTFDEVVGQDVSKKRLQNLIKSNEYSNSIFVGSSGSGKTTCAKILAQEIDGEIHELDCASHNGVADIKDIVDNARIPSLIKKVKVFVLDECQTLSSAAWSSLLIVLEEKLPTAIFIFCTTDEQKIPKTIFSRIQRFDFVPISEANLLKRLKFVCQQENISIADDSLKVIAESAEGSMRQALTNLDTCLSYGELDVTSVRRSLNWIGGKIFVALSEAVHAHDSEKIISYVTAVYQKGYEMHQFVKRFLDYCISQNDLQLMQTLLTTIQDIRYDDNPKIIIIARLLTFGGDGNES